MRFIVTPGGADTYVQFNDGGAFAGSPDLTWTADGLVTTKHSAFGSDAVIDGYVHEVLSIRETVVTGDADYRLNGLYIRSTLDASNPGPGGFRTVAGGCIYSYSQGTSDIYTISGVEFYVSHKSSGDATQARGIVGNVRNVGTGSTITDAVGGDFEVDTYAGRTTINATGFRAVIWSPGVVTTAIGAHIWSAYGGGTIGTNYGLKIDDQTLGSTCYAIHTGLGQVRFGDDVTIASADLTITNGDLHLDDLEYSHVTGQVDVKRRATIGPDGVAIGGADPTTLAVGETFASGDSYYPYYYGIQAVSKLAPTISGTASCTGLAVVARTVTGNDKDFCFLTGVNFGAKHLGTGTANTLYGAQGYAQNVSSGLVGTSYGVFGNITCNAGAMTTAYAVASNIYCTGVITTASGLYVFSPVGGGTIGTLYGLKIDDQAAGSTNYAIHTGLGKVRFGDQVLLPVNTGPSQPVIANEFNNRGSGIYFNSDVVGIASNTLGAMAISYASIVIRSDSHYGFASNTLDPTGESADTKFARAAAGIFDVTSAFQFTEIADPTAPAANKAILFCRDNGGGKSQLCVRFNNGAVQVIATEP